MSSRPIRIDVAGVDSGRSEFAPRALIAFVAVLICYVFQWHWLRSTTLEANAMVVAVFGVRLERIAPDAVLWNGSLYRYVISCTFADVWCGALAFLLDLRRGLRWNAGRLALFTAALFLFNVLRLSASDVMFAYGVPWIAAHDIFAGFCYYGVWQYLWKTRTWR